jgi:DNA-binding response OmpR family regulator
LHGPYTSIRRSRDHVHKRYRSLGVVCKEGVHKRKVILVVEDDPDLRRLYRLTLAFDGFEVQEAVDGIGALRAVEQLAPDLMILDLDLPKLGGLSVQQEIAAHALTRHIPVVIITALELDLAHLDVPCILRKPVTPEQVLTTVRNCLGSAASTTPF